MFWLRSEGSFRKLLEAKTSVRHIHHQPLKAKAKLLTMLIEDIHASVWVSPLPDTLTCFDKYSATEFAFLSFTVCPSLS